MAKITFTYSGNVYDAAPAGTVDFPLTTPAGKAIPYLEKTHIHAYSSSDQGVTWTELTRPTEWDFDSSGKTVRLKAAVSPDWVMVRRLTPYDARYTTFQDSSLLTAEQLNEGEDFSMFVDQELYDVESQGFLSNPAQVVTIPDQKTGKWPVDDTKIATTGAISERLDVYVQDTKPADPPVSETRQPGKLWIDDGLLQISYWEPSAKAWVNLAQTGPQGPPGPNAYFGAVAPVDPTPYGLWFNTVRNELFVKDSTGPTVQWLPSGGPPVTIPTGTLVAGNGVAANASNQISNIDQGVI